MTNKSNRSEKGAKRRIKQNVWGNWNGYEGNKKTRQFGTDYMEASIWVDQLEQVTFIQGDYVETKFVKRDDLPTLCWGLTFWRY